jgi:ubiquinone/menaquinone biosynthesis C-methylase UbiE
VDERTARSIAAYDEVAADYLERWKEHRPLDAVRKFGGLAGRGATVLDAACGPVLDVRLLRDAGLHVVAGDRSHESMKLGKTFFPKGSLACWDYRRLPFLDGVFGGIWAPASLMHLPVRAVRPALAELRRVHGSGPIFVSFPEGQADLEPFDDPPATDIYASRVTADELRALLIAAGYREVETETRPDPLREGLTWVYGWGRLTGAHERGRSRQRRVLTSSAAASPSTSSTVTVSAGLEKGGSAFTGCLKQMHTPREELVPYVAPRSTIDMRGPSAL